MVNFIAHGTFLFACGAAIALQAAAENFPTPRPRRAIAEVIPSSGEKVYISLKDLHVGKTVKPVRRMVDWNVFHADPQTITASQGQRLSFRRSNEVSIMNAAFADVQQPMKSLFVAARVAESLTPIYDNEHPQAAATSNVQARDLFRAKLETTFANIGTTTSTSFADPDGPRIVPDKTFNQQQLQHEPQQFFSPPTTNFALPTLTVPCADLIGEKAGDCKDNNADKKNMYPFSQGSPKPWGLPTVNNNVSINNDGYLSSPRSPTPWKLPPVTSLEGNQRPAIPWTVPLLPRTLRTLDGIFTHQNAWTTSPHLHPSAHPRSQ